MDEAVENIVRDIQKSGHEDPSGVPVYSQVRAKAILAEAQMNYLNTIRDVSKKYSAISEMIALEGTSQGWNDEPGYRVHRLMEGIANRSPDISDLLKAALDLESANRTLEWYSTNPFTVDN